MLLSLALQVDRYAGWFLAYHLNLFKSSDQFRISFATHDDIADFAYRGYLLCVPFRCADHAPFITCAGIILLGITRLEAYQFQLYKTIMKLKAIGEAGGCPAATRVKLSASRFLF